MRDSLTPVSKRSRGIRESEDRKNQVMAYALQERREAEKQARSREAQHPAESQRASSVSPPEMNGPQWEMREML